MEGGDRAGIEARGLSCARTLNVEIFMGRRANENAPATGARTNPLLELERFGQSYWIDDLSRPMIESGELRRRVTEEGLTGVTANPSIFRAAVQASDAYDGSIKALAGRPPSEIYEALIVADVRDACDVLRPVFDRTQGRDGYVSLEVSPRIARDASASVAEARRFWKAVARPNLLIKIPATPEGVTAVEALLHEGINVNITLLFAVDRYAEIATAHIRALERRKAENQPLGGIASVASFFLSRIDTVVDRQLRHKIESGVRQAQRLLGTCAVANARLAYRRFLDLRSSDRWRSLEKAGAHPQRLLWASTSTKDPSYDDLMYVEPLIAADTVTTLPPETIAAFADHGKAAATLQPGIERAVEVIGELETLGIDLAQVARQLLDEGVEKFAEAFDGVLATIAAKSRRTK
jgi:transaldolase